MKTYLMYYPIFWLGYLWFKLTNQTQWYPYISFRRLFVLTKGKSNDKLSERLSKKHPPYPVFAAEGVLGKLSARDIDSIVQSIDENGFHIFKEKLSADKVNALVQFALQTEGELVPPGLNGEKKAVYNRQALLSPRYQFPEKDVMSNPLIQRLAVDPTLFAVAQGYLRSKPIQDLTAMWWSTVFSRVASSEAAQLFHFDMDRFKFIKFFFYLTDVNTHNGPHCYVKGSHKKLPEKLWKDGRIQDKEIFENFPKENILEIDGSKGTIIAVDTRGLHKGKVLEQGERLILQFEFTNSLFGASFEKIDLRGCVLPEVKSVFEKYPYSFQRFTI
jgi:hypothetical protein